MSTSFLARHYNTMTGFPGRITNLAGMFEPWVKEWNVKSALDAGCCYGALKWQEDGILWMQLPPRPQIHGDSTCRCGMVSERL